MTRLHCHPSILPSLFPSIHSSNHPSICSSAVKCHLLYTKHYSRSWRYGKTMVALAVDNTHVNNKKPRSPIINWVFFSNGERQAGVSRMDLQLHGHWRPDENISGQQRPERGEKARDARSWGKILPGRAQKFKAGAGCRGGGWGAGSSVQPALLLSPLFFFLSLLFLSLFPISGNTWSPSIIWLLIYWVWVWLGFVHPLTLSVSLTLNLFSVFVIPPARSCFLSAFASLSLSFCLHLTLASSLSECFPLFCWCLLCSWVEATGWTIW